MTLDIGALHSESFGHSGFAETSYFGQAAWGTVGLPDDPEHLRGYYADYSDVDWEDAQFLHVLRASVPGDLLRSALHALHTRAVASFLQWRDSGIALFTFSCATQALVVAMDLAGRRDLPDLRASANVGLASLALCTGDNEEPRLDLKIVGLREAFEEAELHRRLSTNELVEAIEDLRWILRTDAVFGLLGMPPQDGPLKSLTLAVCSQH